MAGSNSTRRTSAARRPPASEPTIAQRKSAKKTVKKPSTKSANKPIAAGDGESPDVRTIPGIGPTLARDFAHIGVRTLADLRGADPSRLFNKLRAANAREAHATSKNYLYVIRMAVYYADGGRDPEKLRWNVWKD